MPHSFKWNEKVKYTGVNRYTGEKKYHAKASIKELINNPTKVEERDVKIAICLALAEIMDYLEEKENPKTTQSPTDPSDYGF